MHARLGLNVHRDAWPVFAGLLDHVAAAGTEIVADHDLNFAEAEGPAAARLRERAQLEERSLIPLLQRAHSLGITVAIENLAPVYPDDRRRSQDPPAVRDLVRRLDRPAAEMLLDLGHLPIAAHAARLLALDASAATPA